MDYTLEKIKSLLSLRHGAQRDLAARLGVSKQTVSNWVNGRAKSYNDYLPQIAEFFGISIAELVPPSKNPNSIVLSGYICKPPVYRTTPFNREIADLLVAVNRAYNKSDYIPCIAWGRNARFVKNLQVGDKIALSGRIQSREYQKKLSDYEVKTMTAYEVSISKLAAFDSADDFDLDREFSLYTGSDAEHHETQS